MDFSDCSEHKLQITCNNEFAALERLLRIVRFRGFSVTDLHAQLNNSGQFDILLTVESERPVSLLENQLRKNYDVTRVQVLPQAVSQSQGISA
ncbi:acetolactate synthase 2 small subunit [Porticoccus sp. W117]|uniref:acetolactate synthase 2 small subunit n=1 Tax=Porticoccus sp. W117 TaxID=3054777 RepID=UPI002591A879|nr:acetolactate synthase 2 small subunit [Porticoccus sp. W117]MDM3872246.1 acetolactate synthase 2 small subunit [Porticoccus sp. W117]